MRPEPSRQRTPKRQRSPNELQALPIRIGTLRPDLDARSDGTPTGYRKAVMAALYAYYQLMRDCCPQYDLSTARELFMTNSRPHGLDPATLAALDDALHRAVTLYQHGGLSVDDALKASGLVKED